MKTHLFKRLLGVSLAAVLLLAAIPFSASAETSDGLTIKSSQGASDPSNIFVYQKTGGTFAPDEAKLVQYPVLASYASYSGSLQIPSKVAETMLGVPTYYAVTEISGREGDFPGALEGVTLSPVSLPETVTTVGSYALANSSFDQFSFPTSVTNLASSAFADARVSHLTLHVVNEAELLSASSYKAPGRATPVQLPQDAVALQVDAPLKVSGSVAFTEETAARDKITVLGDASLTLGGGLSGPGAIEVENRGLLVLSSSLSGYTGSIRLSGSASQIINETSSPVRYINASGNAASIQPGETALGGDTVSDDPQPGSKGPRPQITVNNGGAVAVQGSGKIVIITPFRGYHVEEVVINDLSMGAITRYEFSKASTENTVKVTFAAGQAPEGPDTPDPDPIFQFKDVDREGWYADAISFMVRNKIFYGVSKDEFAPSDKTTRAMFATLLYRLDDFDEQYGLPCESPAPLTDVRENSWYEKASKWAVGTGVAPIDGTKFNPSQVITREEIAVYLYNFTRSLGVEATADEGILDSYADKDKISVNARDAMAWAVTNGYLTGRSGSKLEPFEGAMRSEIAEILMRYLTSNM